MQIPGQPGLEETVIPQPTWGACSQVDDPREDIWRALVGPCLPHFIHCVREGVSQVSGIMGTDLQGGRRAELLGGGTGGTGRS